MVEWLHMEKELIQELKSLIEGDVDMSEEILNSRSTDYSIFSVKPQVVVFPKHSKDIQELVHWVDVKRQMGGYSDLSLTVRAAGTCMSGGSLNESIIVDTTKYMSGILEIVKKDYGFQYNPITKHSFPVVGHVKVLPGTPYKILEQELEKYSMVMPCFPASKNLCAVGGMVGNNGAGEKSLKYGQNKDFVLELKAVFSDGNEYHVKPISKTELDAKMIEDTFEGRLYRSVWNLIQRNRNEIKEAKPKTTKNSSGYLIWDVWDEETQTFDLTKMIVGAQGTTAIITEITYKVVPIETFSNLLVLFADSSERLPKIVENLSGFDIETMEVYDKHTFKFAVRFFKDFLKDKGILGILKYAFNFIPEIWMSLTGGIPEYVVLIEFVSNDRKEIEGEAIRAEKALGFLKLPSRILTTEKEIEKYWNIRRDSFKLLSDHSKKLRTAPFIDDCVIPVVHYPAYMKELTELLDSRKLLYTVAGHLGNGNLHVIPLMDFQNPETQKIIFELSEKVYTIVKKYEGSITAEHNDGIIRTPYLPYMFGDHMVSVFQELKDIFDMRNIFNPKKKVGGTVEDIQNWIIKPRQK